MIKVKFDNYTYFDPNETDVNKAKPFDKAYFNELIANRQYLDAADYADKYHFDEFDPVKDRDYRNRIINLRRRGRQLQAIYSRIGDKTDAEAVSFVDGVFLNNESTISGSGTYGEDFTKIKRGIGSFGNKEATSLSITFPSGKRKLFGIDALAADTEDSIENFYEQSGLSKEDLVAAGVVVKNIDGNTILNFSKTNSLANKIIYNIPRNKWTSDITIKGIDASGNYITEEESVTHGRENPGELSPNQASVEEFKQFIDNANQIKQKYLADLNNAMIDYSSTAAPWISDELYQLQQMGLTEDEYNRQAKLVAPNIFKALNSLSSSRYEFYSDAYNNDSRDETLKPMSNTERAELADLIASTSPSKIQVDAMVSNGKVGALVTLLGTTNNGQKDTGEIKIQPKRVFIPGLLVEEAQKRINMDSSYRAVQEINSMIDLGYDYKLQNGEQLRLDSNGEFNVTNTYMTNVGTPIHTYKPISREEAIKILNKDMIIEESKAALKYAYMNSNGNIFDKEGYEAKAREITLNSINDLYDDMNVVVDPATKTINIIDQYGRKHNATDLFNQRIDKNKTQFDVYDRLSSIYDVYNQIMQDLMKYI